MQPTRDQIVKSVFTEEPAQMLKHSNAQKVKLSTTIIIYKKKQTLCCGDLKAKISHIILDIPLQPGKLTWNPTNDLFGRQKFPFQLGWFLASFPCFHKPTRCWDRSPPASCTKRRSVGHCASQYPRPRLQPATFITPLLLMLAIFLEGRKDLFGGVSRELGKFIPLQVFADWLCFHDFSTENSAY